MKESIMPFDSTPQLPQRQFLKARTTLQLDDAEGTVIAVERGCLWVTMEHDARDIVLMPGMRFEIDRSGRTIISAEEDSRFGLLAPGDCPEGIAAWIARKLSASAGRKSWRCAPYY
jgi:Protein of unknown function (DUF2917)